MTEPKCDETVPVSDDGADSERPDGRDVPLSTSLVGAEDFYDLLGIEDGANRPIVEAVCQERRLSLTRALASTDDPDRETERTHAHVEAAERVLTDPTRRKVYDSVGHDAYAGLSVTDDDVDELLFRIGEVKLDPGQRPADIVEQFGRDDATSDQVDALVDALGGEKQPPTRVASSQTPPTVRSRPRRGSSEDDDVKTTTGREDVTPSRSPTDGTDSPDGTDGPSTGENGAASEDQDTPPDADTTCSTTISGSDASDSGFTSPDGSGPDRDRHRTTAPVPPAGQETPEGSSVVTGTVERTRSETVASSRQTSVSSERPGPTEASTRTGSGRAFTAVETGGRLATALRDQDAALYDVVDMAEANRRTWGRRTLVAGGVVLATVGGTAVGLPAFDPTSVGVGVITVCAFVLVAAVTVRRMAAEVDPGAYTNENADTYVRSVRRGVLATTVAAGLAGIASVHPWTWGARLFAEGRDGVGALLMPRFLPAVVPVDPVAIDVLVATVAAITSVLAVASFVHGASYRVWHDRFVVGRSVSPSFWDGLLGTAPALVAWATVRSFAGDATYGPLLAGGGPFPDPLNRLLGLSAGEVTDATLVVVAPLLAATVAVSYTVVQRVQVILSDRDGADE